jgi:voltage-gated potassium channel
MTAPPRAKPSESGGRTALPRRNLIERTTSKFFREPPSVRLAARVIILATLVFVVGGGILIRFVDHKEYANVFVGMWWAIQTVTTVGYGDVTPREVSGRLVATLLMLEGIAFLAIVTAVITSTFVARAQRERGGALEESAESSEQHLGARFDRLEERLDRIDATLRDSSSG